MNNVYLLNKQISESLWNPQHGRALAEACFCLAWFPKCSHCHFTNFSSEILSTSIPTLLSWQWAQASIHLGKMAWDGLTNSFLIWFSSYSLGVFRISFTMRVLPWSAPNSLARNDLSGLGESMLLKSLLGPSPHLYMCTLASSPHSEWFTPSSRGVYTSNSLLENQRVLHTGNG